jgi:glycosyltransferase involved in cell wall biosynthesis
MFSVLLPVVKTKYFKEAFESAINQEFDDYEIVVVNNKADSDISWVKEYPRVRYFEHKEQLPACDNWNFCIQQGRGEFVKFLCDDDIMLPKQLASIADFLTKNDCDVVLINADYFEDEKTEIVRNRCPIAGLMSVERFLTVVDANSFPWLPFYALRRLSLLKKGGFPQWGNNCFGALVDTLLPFQVAIGRNRIGCIPDVLYLSRINSDQLINLWYAATVVGLRGNLEFYKEMEEILSRPTILENVLMNRAKHRIQKLFYLRREECYRLLIKTCGMRRAFWEHLKLPRQYFPHGVFLRLALEKLLFRSF